MHHIYLTFKSYGSGRLTLRQLVAANMGATLINYFYIYILLIFITQVLLLLHEYDIESELFVELSLVMM